MALEAIAQIDQLAMQFGHLVGKFVDRLWRARAGNDVLTLGLDQIFAEQLVLASVRVAREGDTGCRGIVEIAENHCDDVDRRAVDRA